MRVYLDNCCYNRPFDDQHNLATALESFAKLQIQSLMRSGELEYVRSDSLCHEIVKNPFPRRFKSIIVWLGGAAEYVDTTGEIIQRAKDFEAMGVKKMDALHLVSAEAASCDWFSTTDKGILRKVRDVGGMRVANPVEFITWRQDND